MTISTTLKKEEEKRFRILAKKLNLSEYKLLKLIVIEFLQNPSSFPNIYKDTLEV